MSCIASIVEPGAPESPIEDTIDAAYIDGPIKVDYGFNLKWVVLNK